MANDTTEDQAGRGQGALHTFLIADVRGYTRYSDEHGDEAASQLAHRFAAIVREAVPPQGGEVLELRGDEALCVFGSARAALWTAVELQRRFRERVDGEPALPLGIGIGLDAGEAVPTEGGYRGRALNVASRLCSLARPGEILASETVTNLAGRQEKARYAPRRPTRVKGLEEPVRHVELVPEVELPPLPPLPPPRSERRRVRRRWLLLGALAGAALALGVVLAVIVLSTTDSDENQSPISVGRNSVAVIDLDSNEVVGAISVGNAPTSVAVGEGAVWVLNSDDATVSRIDPETRRVVRTIATGITPADLAVGEGSVWLADNEGETLARIDPGTSRVETIELPPTHGGFIFCDYTLPGLLGVGEGSIWIARCDQTVARVDPAANESVALVSRVEPGPIATGVGAVWVAGPDRVARIDPRTSSVSLIDVAPSFEPLLDTVVGFGSVWASQSSGVWKIDPDTNQLEETVAVGAGAFGLDVDEHAVWVANSGEGTVSRIDPRKSEVVATIGVGGFPRSVAAGEGAVWVTVD